MIFCRFCMYSAKWQSQVNRHENSVHLKLKYVCSICQMTYTQKSLLTQHTKQEHTPNHPYKCNECGYVSHTPILFQRHFKRHFNSIKVFTCPKCPGFRSEHKRNFVRHTKKFHSDDEELSQLLHNV